MSLQQEIFNKVVNHLRKQGCASKDPEIELCNYRGPNNTKCAIGVLISDDLYSSKFEAKDINMLIQYLADRIDNYGETKYNSLHTFLWQNQKLLETFQLTHDESPVDKWEEDFQSIASKFNLKYIAP